MSSKHQVHNLIILDESGSMQSIAQNIVAGFNELVQTIHGVEARFPEQEHIISMVSFNTAGTREWHWREPAKALQQLNADKYAPAEMTPLFDAMGFSITRLARQLELVKGCNVLVTILTDGAENASKEYTGDAIKKLVEELKGKGWTFTYIGTEHDVDGIALSLSITNVLKFEKSALGMHNMFEEESKARHRFSDKLREGKNAMIDFYTDDDKPK